MRMDDRELWNTEVELCMAEGHGGGPLDVISQVEVVLKAVGS